MPAEKSLKNKKEKNLNNTIHRATMIQTQQFVLLLGLGPPALSSTQKRILDYNIQQIHRWQWGPITISQPEYTLGEMMVTNRKSKRRDEVVVYRSNFWDQIDKQTDNGIGGGAIEQPKKAKVF
ncbi:hypothetical protein B0H15DRAFT_807340 [Mycena belliarum]|uniref:Uncharacterized protein n=1 Tax=Mycena belliarum TaxID=1033014 RepID=A0AAD6TL91_9AGAR|nr:hypothetical protein B0H15DRAFT_807340 [Mycena belliae]